MKFSELKAEFLKWKQTQALAATTTKNYEQALVFIEDCWTKTVGKPVEKVNADDIRMLISYMYDRKVQRKKRGEGFLKGFWSFNYCKGILKQLFRYKLRDDIVKIIGRLEKEEPDIYPISLEEFRNIIAELDNLHEQELAEVEARNNEIKHGQKRIAITNPERDKVMLSVLFGTGLRASELITLRQGDIVAGKQLGRVKGKGSKAKKDRFYFILHSEKLLADYIEKNKYRIKKANGFIFLRNDNLPKTKRQPFKPLNYFSLYKLFLYNSDNLYGERDDKHVYLGFRPHTLRHSSAVYLINSGWSPSRVQVFLRHANVQTTSRYLKESDVELKTEIAALPKADSLGSS